MDIFLLYCDSRLRSRTDLVRVRSYLGARFASATTLCWTATDESRLFKVRLENVLTSDYHFVPTPSRMPLGSDVHFTVWLRKPSAPDDVPLPNPREGSCIGMRRTALGRSNLPARGKP